jgi:hypothetical protein
MRDVGTGGVDGFDELDDGIRSIEPAYFKGEHGKGGHGAALSEPNLPSIVKYLTTGKLDEPPKEVLTEKSEMFSRISRVAEPVAFGGTATAVLLTGRWILQRPSPRRLAIATAALGVIWVVGRTL